MQVAEVMATDLVTVARGEPLAVAVERMLAAHAGSAIVVEDDEIPVGIVTNSDVLRSMLETGDTLRDVTAASVMSTPIETVKPDDTVKRALRLMAMYDIKKLPVVDDLDLVGIITTTDIARRLPDHIEEVRRIEAQRSEWTEEE